MCSRLNCALGNKLLYHVFVFLQLIFFSEKFLGNPLSRLNGPLRRGPESENLRETTERETEVVSFEVETEKLASCC